MSTPTQVVENGRWVTRLEDPHHVLARNRDQTGETSEPKAPIFNIPKPPSLGILTRTLVKTPVLKWIIPARIRHRTKNDVLFISADSVEIREAHGNYTLDHVASKDDFDSPIKAARIFGSPRELTQPDIGAIVMKEEEYWQDTPNVVKYEEDYAMGDDADDHLKIEEDESINEQAGNGFNDEDLRSMNAVPLCKRELPPHVLVLALESNKLVFLYFVNGTSRSPHLVSSQIPLPAQPILNQLGEHLAVDPKSRAMAVAAHEGVFILYALRSTAELRSQVKSNNRIDPIKAERPFMVDGTIVRMEFVYPPQKDHGQAVLLLVISKNGKTKLVWYEWNSTIDLHEAQITPSQQLLPQEEQVPLLLIPVLAYTAFILVCEKCISLYRDLLTGTPTRYAVYLEHQEEPEEPGSSKRSPVWVQWARPMRSKAHGGREDGVYLCREDGVVHFLGMKYNVAHMIDSTHRAGKIGINIDTSFACLDVGPTTVDLLAVGGDGSEGGFWVFKPREHPENLWVRPNWTPLTDVTTASIPTEDNRLTGNISSRKETTDGRERLFACTGKARHGIITELRYGLQLSRVLTVEIGDKVKHGVLGVWALHSLSEHTIFVLISHPTRTSLLLWQSNHDVELVEDSSGLDLDARTIAAGNVAEEQIIQVTETSIIAASMRASRDQALQKIFSYEFAPARVLLACIGVSNFESLILVAVQEYDQYYLRIGHAGNTYESSGGCMLPHSQPSALSFKSIGAQLFAFVGSLDGALRVYIIQEESTTCQVVNEYYFGGNFAICESIAILTPHKEEGSSPMTGIVCGLRNGLVHTLCFTQTGSSYNICLSEELVIGHTSVKAIADNSQAYRAILHCEDSLCTLQYPQTTSVKGLGTVNKIWITDPNDPGTTQGRLFAVTSAEIRGAESVAIGGLASGSLVCIDSSALQIFKFGDNLGPQNISRRILVDGTPQRILYSKRLNKLIVLSLEIEALRPPQTIGHRTQPGKRALRPVITFLDPHKDNTSDSDGSTMAVDREATEDGGTHQSSKNRLVLNYKPGERFLGITEWFPRLNANEYHMLVVNTRIMADRQAEKGRLIFYSVSRTGGDFINLVLKKEMEFNAPVYSALPYPNGTSIVYCSGNDLCMLSLDATPSGPKWSAPTKAVMFSPGRFITIREPYIYVSSSRESLGVYKFENGAILYQYGDQVARPAIHHLNIPELSLVLAADMHCSVTGLWQPPARNTSNSMSTIFEATLPRSVTRLHRVTRPLWHQSTSSNHSIRTHTSFSSFGGGEVEAAMASSARGPATPASAMEGNKEAVIGTTTDGTIMQFEILLKGWPLLRFIQNMAEFSSIICPLGDSRMRRRIEQSNNDPRDRHINGDILARLIDRGGEALLRQMLEKEPHDRERCLEFDSAEEREARLKELAGEVLDVEKEDWLGEVVLWIKYLLRSAL